MNTYYINFKGYCAVEATNKEQAEEKFFNNIYSDANGPLYDESYEVEKIEEVSVS